MKVAVAHDWLGPMTGAERVLEQVLLCYPDADVFTAVDYLAPEHRAILHGARVTPSFIQRLPRSRTRYWDYIPLMPLAFEQFDLEPYDLVVSCSHTAAKGVIVHPHQVHVCYLLSPLRFAWDLQALYFRDGWVRGKLKSIMARAVLHWLRMWDTASAARVDAFVACSAFVARRAQLAYRRDCDVVHPPCDVDFFTPGSEPREGFYLAASRLTRFKRLDLIVEAFRDMPGRQLVVIGAGPDEARLRARCTPNIRMLGAASNEVLRDHMRRARAYIFAAPEDFGIVMAEAQACGTPVIALGRGGAKEIVSGLDADDPTGVFFAEQRAADVQAAVDEFERNSARISALACRRNAERFSPERFRSELVACVNAAVARYSVQARGPG